MDELLEPSGLRGVPEGWRTTAGLSLHGLAALHFADALGREVYFEFAGSTEHLKRKPAVCAPVVVLVSEVPDLDLVGPKHGQEPPLDVVVSPETIGVTSADGDDTAGSDVIEKGREGRALVNPEVGSDVLRLDVDFVGVPPASSRDLLGPCDLVRDREVGRDALLPRHAGIERPPAFRRCRVLPP
ncbi:hypothetical protein WMF41_16655 [Sorangium sp. So ce1151]